MARIRVVARLPIVTPIRIAAQLAAALSILSVALVLRPFDTSNASVGAMMADQTDACVANGEPSAESGDNLYALARGALERQAYPSSVRYSITVTAFERTERKSADYVALFHAANNVVRVDHFSRQERERPHVARGSNVWFQITLSMGGPTETILRKQLSKSETPTDILGIPELVPNYTFGMARFAAAAQTAAPDATSMPVIGSVTSRQRTYHVLYVGADRIGAVDLIHLSLQPVRDAERNRLREMWLDPHTCLPVKLRVAGNFTRSPATAVPWTITYQNVGGTLYLESESADAQLTVSGHTYDGLAITFGEFTTSVLSGLDELDLDFRRSASDDVLREPS